MALRILAAAALMLAQTAAAAETPDETIRAFGLLGTWSPDCAGSIRVTYSVPPGGAPTATAVIDGTEQAVSEIQAAVRLAPDRISWTGIYRKYSPLDAAPQPWMPQPGEVWETVLERVGDRIRSLKSQRRDGQKILVDGGFYYDAREVRPGGPVVWRKTDEETPFFGQCRRD